MKTYINMRKRTMTMDQAKDRVLRYISHGRRTVSIVAQFLMIKTTEAIEILDALVDDGKVEKLIVTNKNNTRKAIYAMKDDLSILEIPMFRVAIPKTNAKPRVHHDSHPTGSGLTSLGRSLTGGMYSLVETYD